jgi:hypothetical protein
VLEDWEDVPGPLAIGELERVPSAIFELTHQAIDRAVAILDLALGVIEPLLKQSNLLPEKLDRVGDDVGHGQTSVLWRDSSSRRRFAVGSPNSSMSNGSAKWAGAVLIDAKSSAASVIRYPSARRPSLEARAG